MRSLSFARTFFSARAFADHNSMADGDAQQVQQTPAYSTVQKIKQKLILSTSSSEFPSELEKRLKSCEKEKEEMKKQLIRSQEEMMAMKQEMKEMSLQIKNQEQEEEETLTASSEGELPQCEQHLKQKSRRTLSDSFLSPPKKRDLLELTPEQEMKTHDTSNKKLNVVFRMKNETVPMTISRGSATTDKNFAYFVLASSTFLYQYSWTTETWRLLPIRLQYQNSALVMINGVLTAVGGIDKRLCRRNTLLSLQEYQWTERYPPMHRCRSTPAVVSTPSGHCIIVAGGLGLCSIRSKSVELFVLSTESWYEVTELPKPLPRPCAVICVNELFVIDDSEGFSCSIRHLEPSGGGQITPNHTLSWNYLPPLPVKESSCATLCNRLVVVGGFRCSEFKDYPNPALNQEFLHLPSCIETCNYVWQLQEGEWIMIGSLKRPRRSCLTVTPLPDKMLIVGGWKENTVEECLVLDWY